MKVCRYEKSSFTIGTVESQYLKLDERQSNNRNILKGARDARKLTSRREALAKFRIHPCTLLVRV